MRPVLLTVVACVVSFVLPSASAQTPSAEQILKQFRPAQRNVVFDTPEPKDFPNCRVEIERGKGSAGFVVYGPAGQVLRRFTDTNGDSKADRFRFYQMGLEVYRDIDSDKDEKPDQHRWMNWGGVRWGIDTNKDGKSTHGKCCLLRKRHRLQSKP